MNTSSLLDIYSLSPLQEGILFHWLMTKEGSMYLEQSAFTIHGTINLEGLEEAIGIVCSRHDILHTVFAHEGLKKPVQIVHKPKPFHFEVNRDLSGLDPERQKETIDRYILLEREQGFDLSRGPLLRVAVFQLDKDIYRMVWSFHHIIMDGWSLGLLIGDLFAVYSAMNDKRELPPKGQPFRVYIDWLKKQDDEKAKNFWKERFQDFREPSRLPRIGGIREKTSEISLISTRLSRETTERIKETAVAWQVTPNLLMQAAWAILVGRLSRSQDISFGVVVSGRPASIPGVESIIGLFINNIPRRIYWDDTDSLRSIALRIRDLALSETEYDHVSLASIQTVLGRQDIVDHLFIYENYPGERRFGNYVIKDFDSFERTNYPFLVEISPDSEFIITFKFDGGEFGEAFVKIMLDGYIHLLENPSVWEKQGVSCLKIFDDEAPTASRLPETVWPATVLEAIKQNAQKQPELIAIQDNIHGISYGDLWNQSGRVADFLAGLGIKTGDIVAVSASHSVETVYIIVGILRAGAAFLPIDPSYPAERMEFILEDSKARVLLHDSRCHYEKEIELLKLPQGLQHYEISSIVNEKLPSCNHAFMSELPDRGDAAYIIYTSGSTGQPKGVLVEHGNLASYIESCKKEYIPAGTPVSMPFFTSIGFDLTITSVFFPLSSGGRVVAIEEPSFDKSLASIVSDPEINFVKLTPAHLQVLCSMGIPGKQQLSFIVGGEALSTSLCEAALELFGPNTLILNEYGPTETTVGCITGRFDSEKTDSPYVPIGFPLPNAAIRIINECGITQPLGATGEIEISGPCVSRGYLGVESGMGLNSRFSENDNGRSYRSGDLGRYMPDGSIEYLGRMDNQVKIRGYRIELEEVESAISKILKSGQVAVRVIENEAGEKYLCAYIAPKSIDTKGLLENLGSSLPDYMLPSHIVSLDAMQVNRNGKIDRDALPLPEITNIVPNRDSEDLDPLEKTVLACASAALGIPEAGLDMDADFFRMGGDSLKAVRLVGSLKQKLECDVEVSDVFRFRSLNGIARALRSRPRRKKSAIKKAEERKYYPASFSQEQMYILREMGETGTEYNISGGIFLAPWVREEDLGRLLEDLAAGHESLRTYFEIRDGQIYQFIKEKVEIGIENLGQCPVEEAENTARAWVRPFDLSMAPLFRCGILRLNDGRRILLIDMHHIISDGYSLGIMMSEITQALRGGRITRPEIAYRDYAVWQREVWDPSIDREYWIAKHSNKLEPLELRKSQTPLTASPSSGFSLVEMLDEELAGRIEGVVSQLGITASMFLMAAYYLMLWKESGQNEIVIGTPVAGRNQQETAGVIGLFINTVGMRLAINPSDSVQILLEKVRDEMVEALEHGEYPLEVLLEDLNAARAGWHNMLFNTLYVWQEESWSDLRGLGTEFSEFSWPENNVKFDLTLVAVRNRNNIKLEFSFASYLWDEPEARRFMDRYLLAIDEMLGGMDRRLDRLCLLTSPEETFLKEAEYGQVVQYRNESFSHRLASITKEDPERAAILWKNTEITYSSLQKWVSGLAYKLQYGQTGTISTENVVAVLCKRGPEYIASCMAAFWAGCVYMPLDIKAPLDRLVYQLSDSGAKTLIHDLANKELAQSLAAQLDGIALLSAHEESSGYTAEPLEYSPRQGAYLIYTSGSTGKPKGVLVEHEGLSSLMQYHATVFGMNPGDRVLQFSNMVFDASIWEMSMWLAGGACLCLGDEEEVFDTDNLAKLLAFRAITAATITPPFLRAMDPSVFSGMRILVSAGSELDPSLARKLRQYTRLINGYGPTETTVCAASYDVPGDLEPGTNIPIGMPMLNSRIRIIGQNGLPLVPGAIGEIEVSGVLVARGYLNRPDLTEASFGMLDGQRRYLTGDRGRWLPDRNLEYFGRFDGQIKIRGNRVETGEIEQVIAECSGVKESAVKHMKGEGDEGYLIGYVVPCSVDINELNAELKRKLPSYMIPLRIVGMKSIPINRNGKTDYKALPVPELNETEPGLKIEAKDEFERQILEAAAEALGTDISELGMTDDFFAAGGDSLKAIRYASLLKHSTGRELAVKDIFAFRTPLDMARLLRGRLHQTRQVDLARVEDRPFYPLTYSQERMYLLRAMGVSGTEYNIYSGVILPDWVETEDVENILAGLIDRHESLRTSFRMDGQNIVQVIHEDVDFGLEEIGLFPADKAKDAARAWVRPFDLEEAPLFRAGILSLDDGRRILLLDMHHIISDGVSIGILLSELAETVSGKTPLKRETRYRDFAVWQREVWNPDLSAAYWLERFSDPVQVLELGTDRPRPAIQDFSGNTLYLEFNETLAVKLEHIAASLGATLPMLMMAAYYLLLWKNSGQNDIVVGTPVAGRNQTISEGIVGLFVNTLPVRFKLDQNESLSEMIDRLRMELLGAYEHGEYPLELLVDQVEVRRDAGRNPLFDVLFVWQESSWGDFESIGKGFEAFSWSSGMAKFDLTLILSRTGSGISVSLDYSTALWNMESAQGLLDNYKSAVEAMTDNLSRPVGAISILSEDDLRILEGISRGPVMEFEQKTLAELLHELSIKDPERNALRWKGGSIGYRELAERCAGSAQYLRNLAARNSWGKEPVIAVLSGRGHDLVASALSIFWAGMVYLPLDTGSPEDRLAYQIMDSGAVCLIYESGHEKKARQVAAELENVCLMSSSDSAGAGSPPEPYEASRLAYIIYTSGSTGKPKGVAVEWHGLASFGNHHRTVRGLTPGDKILQFSNPTFDASIDDFSMWLFSGGELCLASEEELLDINGLRTLIKDLGVTVATLPPPYLRGIGAEAVKGLNLAICAGSELDHALASELVKYTRVINAYGPTETTIGCTSYELPRQNLALDRIPIGSPIPNVEIRIVDSRGRLMPIGAMGEIEISGIGLARKYLNNPDVTAERFPFRDGKRRYLTGDLGRWKRDGNIEYFGRKDNQVKIRGYRIELNEIEGSIKSLDGVRDAVVITRGSLEAGLSIVAYVASDRDASFIRGDISRILPKYMIPSYWVIMDSLPLNRSGKVDVSALPSHISGGKEAADTFTSGDEIEQLLAAELAAILGVNSLARDADFFESGGDSISAIQLCARLRNHGLELEVKDVFANPTIEGMRSVIRFSSPQPDDEEDEGDAALVPVQRWFFDTDNENIDHFNQSVVMERKGGFDPAALKKAFDTLLGAHSALRSSFSIDETGQADTTVKIVAADYVFELDEGDDEGLAVRQKGPTLHHALDIRAGRLLAARLYKGKTLDHLQIVIHHLAVDIVSWNPIIAELLAYYEQAARGIQPIAQRERMPWRSWTQKIAGLDPDKIIGEVESYYDRFLLKAASRMPSSENPGTWGESLAIPVSISLENIRRLRTGIKKLYGMGIKEGLLLTLGRAFTGVRNIDAVMIDIEGHGRNTFQDIDVSGTVGWFTNISPLALQFDSDDFWDRAAEDLSVQQENTPLGGLGWVYYHHYCNPASRKPGKTDILFNYAGEIRDAASSDNMRIINIDDGPKIDLKRLRSHLYEINLALGPAGATGEIRTVDRKDARERAASVSSAWNKAVIELIAHCDAHGLKKGKGYTKKNIDAADRKAIMEAIRRMNEQ